MAQMNSHQTRVQCDGGRRELLVDGVVQSIDVASATASDYWPLMLPDVKPERALLLGAGGGTLAGLLLRRFGTVLIVAVDNDPEVVRLGRASFYLNLAEVSVVVADAFQFVAGCRGRFDFIAVDLFRGNERPRGLSGRPFLRDLQRVAGPGATAAFNLFHGRRIDTTLARITRVLTPVRQVAAGKNVVAHYRLR
jgi:spermidine synthase